MHATYGPEIQYHVYLYGITYHLVTQRVPYTPDGRHTVQGEITTSWQTVGDDSPMFNSRIDVREV